MRCVCVGEVGDGEVLQLCGAGLCPTVGEGTYVVEGDLLVVPAKRRRSSRPANPNVPPLSASHPECTLQKGLGPPLK